MDGPSQQKVGGNFLLLLLVHDPNFVFRNFHQDVSRFTVHKGLRPNSRIMYRFFTSHQPMMNEQDQVTWTNWPERRNWADGENQSNQNEDLQLALLCPHLDGTVRCPQLQTYEHGRPKTQRARVHSVQRRLAWVGRERQTRRRGLCWTHVGLYTPYGHWQQYWALPLAGLGTHRTFRGTRSDQRFHLDCTYDTIGT